MVKLKKNLPEAIDLQSCSFLRTVHNPRPKLSITVVKTAVSAPLTLHIDNMYELEEMEWTVSIKNTEIYFPGTYLQNFHSFADLKST